MISESPVPVGSEEQLQSALSELVTLAAFNDDVLAGVPSPLVRRNLQQQSIFNGAEMAGQRFQDILTILDDYDYQVEDEAVDYVAGQLTEYSGYGPTIQRAASHIKNNRMADAPQMNAQNSPPFAESALNAVNVGTAFVVGDWGTHLFLERPMSPPAYFNGKWATVSGMTLGGQVFWGRDVFTDPEMILWQARIASLLTIEYYTTLVPTLQSMEPWIATLYNEAPGEVADIERSPVSEDATLKLISGLGHMTILIKVLENYLNLPPLPKIDVPLPNAQGKPTFQSDYNR